MINKEDMSIEEISNKEASNEEVSNEEVSNEEIFEEEISEEEISDEEMAQIETELNEVTFEIEPSRIAGDYALKLIKDGKFKYVLNKYAPRKKVSEDFKLDTYNRSMVFVIFGFGLGYGIEKMYESLGEDIKILVVEPQEQLLEAQKELVDMEKFNKICFFSGSDFDKLDKVLGRLLQNDSVFNGIVMVHQQYTVIYETYIAKVLKLIQDFHIRAKINMNTLKSIDHAYITNSIKNSKRLNESYAFTSLKDKYKDVPAVVVSAGPSLDKNIAALKDFEGVIICGGRTIDSVRKIGKEPDFACLLDFSKEIKETFNKELDVPLIVTFQASHYVVGDYNGKLYFNDHKRLCKQLVDIELPKISVSGTVATLCMESARYMGCDPIIFIGQDLAYDGDKYYSTSCNILEDKVKKARPIYVEGFHGTDVRTDNLFLVYLRALENYIGVQRKGTFINATEGGVKIKGTIQMTLKEAVETYTDFTKIPELNSPLFLEEKVDINERLNDFRLKCEEIHRLTAEALEVLEELNEEYKSYDETKSPEKIKKYLDELDELEKEMTKQRVLKILEFLVRKHLAPIILDDDGKDQVGRTDLENARAIAESNTKMYEALSVATEQVIEIVKNNIEIEEKDE